MEIIGTSSVIAEMGLPARVSQASSQPSSPRLTRSVPGQAASNADEASATGRNQEIDSGIANLEQAVWESVEELNNFIRPHVTSLQFSVDKDLGKVVVKIMDSETKEVIKQIPSEEVLALTKALSKVSGLFVKQKA